MNNLNERPRTIWRRLLQHAMAKIKDMARSATRLLEDICRTAANLTEISKECHWFEVALNCAILADHLPRFIESHAPIDADDACPTFGEKR